MSTPRSSIQARRRGATWATRMSMRTCAFFRYAVPSQKQKSAVCRCHSSSCRRVEPIPGSWKPNLRVSTSNTMTSVHTTNSQPATIEMRYSERSMAAAAARSRSKYVYFR